LHGKGSSVNAQSKQTATTKYIVVDTNILIYVISGALPADIFPVDKTIICPSIVMIEALGYQDITVLEEKKLRNIILSQCIVAPLDGDVVEQAVNIRQLEKIKTPDAIVAATAIENNAELWTRNVKDFIKVEDLIVHNPFND